MKNQFGFFRKTTFGFATKGSHSIPGTAAGLNLTPMIDMLTIILVFLIKSYSVTPEYLTPTQKIDWAVTTSEKNAPDSAVLIVGQDGILIDGRVVVPFKKGTIDATTLKNGQLPELLKALTAMAAKTQFIAAKNSSVKFTGTLILQADKNLPFEVLKPILRTAGLAGYNDIKFAGVYPD
jgi:biopolymer transport protein ExbD